VQPQLRQRIFSEASLSNISVEQSFYTSLDKYVERFFRYSTEREKTIIQAYLGQAALRIAKAEGKSTVQAEDVKAAVWLFHVPEQPDDPCATAGNQALLAEQQRGQYRRGLLTEGFRDFLDNL
jgi:histone H3/H4